MARTRSSRSKPVPRSAGRAVAQLLHTTFRGGSTPARLRLWMITTAALAVAFGVFGAMAVDRRDSALRSAHDTAGQLIAVQDVQVSLVNADALATENYLRGGPEDAEQRAKYTADLERVSVGLVQVAASVQSADDAASLEAVSSGLVQYAGLVEQARANNRQGYPIGAAYLRAANAVAATDVQALRAVQDSLRNGLNDDLDRADGLGVWLHLFGWSLLAVLLLGGWWLAGRFRRLLNVPLAAATVLTVVVLAVVGISQATAMSDAEDAISGPLQAADLAAQARTAAFDARTHELLTLINRGNGAADEQAWEQSTAVAVVALTRLCDLASDCIEVEQFRAVVEAHTELRDLDDGGDWDGAKDTSLTGNARIQFDRFTQQVAGTAESHAAAAEGALASASDGLSTMRVVVFLTGLAVAALSLAGYGRRSREYR